MRQDFGLATLENAITLWFMHRKVETFQGKDAEVKRAGLKKAIGSSPVPLVRAETHHLRELTFFRSDWCVFINWSMLESSRIENRDC